MNRLALTALFLSLCLAGCTLSAPPTTDLDADAAQVTGDIVVKVSEHASEPIDAPDAAPPDLSLADALRRTVLHDPRLQTALAHVRAARADADQSRLLPNPILSVSVRLRERESPVIDGSLAADLVAILQRPRKASAADHRLRAAATEVLSTLADVVAEAAQSYADVQALDDQIATLAERQQVSDRLADLGSARLKAGETSSLDVLALQTQRLQTKVDIALKRAEMSQARLTLARLIGEPSSTAAWHLSKWTPPPPPRAAERNWITAAVRNRVELRAKRWELAALGDEEALARWAIWDTAEVNLQTEQDIAWSVGPGLSTPLPIFDWGQAKQAKAAAEIAAARHEMTLLQRQVIQDVRTQFLLYDQTLQTLRLARDQLLPLQERRAAQAEASYRAGETDVANLLLATEELLDARVKLVELQQKATVSRIKLQRAVGGIGAAADVEAAAAADVEAAAATRPATSKPAEVRP